MASKGTVALQLQIDTTFKNAKEAVANLNKTLSGIKIDQKILNSSGTAIIEQTKTKAKEIQDILNQIQGKNYTGVNNKFFNDLFKQLDTKAIELKSLQDKLSGINFNTNVKNPTADLDQAKKDLQVYNENLQTATQLLNELKQKQAQQTYNPESNGYKQTTADIEKYTKIQSEAQFQVEFQTERIKELEEELAKYQVEQNKANQAQENANQVAKDTSKLLNDIDDIRKNGLNTMAGQKATLSENTKEQKENEEATRKNAKAQEELDKQTKEAAEAAEKASQAWAQTSSTFVSDFERAASGSDKLTSALEMQIAKWTSLGFVVHTATNAIRDIVQTYQELDDNLSAISAVSGISTNQLWGNMPQMIDNANELALSIDDLTNGMLLFYQQGLSTEETEIRLNAAGKMAAISQQDLATAVDQLTSTMNAFGMNGEDATNVVDVFAKMASKTATDVEELATAMARTASIAKNAGMTFEQTTAFIATMEETTRLSAEVIGNSLKSIIARFQKLKTDPDTLLEDGVNANDVEKALKKADVALRDTEGNFRNIGDVIMELSGKWNTLDTNTQKYIATMAAGVQQSSNFIALVSNNQSNIDNLAYALDAAGAAEEQFGAISNNISSALTRLDNNWTKLKTSFDNGRNIIVDVVNNLSSLVNLAAELGPNFIAIATTLGLATVKMGLFTIKTAKHVATEKILSTIERAESQELNKSALATDLVTMARQKQSVATIKLRLETEKLTEAEKEDILNSYKQATAKNAEVLTWGNLKIAIGEAWAQLKAFATTPIGGLTILISAIVGINSALDYFGISVKGATEQLNKARSEWESTSSELKNTQEQLNTISQKIDEINGKDIITLTDAQDLVNLQQESIELENQINLLKEKDRFQRNKTIQEERDKFNAYTTEGNVKNAFFGTNDSLKSKIEEYKTIKDKDWSGQLDQKFNEWYRNNLQKELLDQLELADNIIKDIGAKIEDEGEESLAIWEKQLLKAAQDNKDSIQEVLSPESFASSILFETIFSDPETLTAARNAGKKIKDQLVAGIIDDGEAQIQIGNLVTEYLADPELLKKIGASADDVQNMSDALIELALNEGNARDNLAKLNSSVQKYGNIANDSRQIITWNSEAIQKWGDALASWGINADELEGSISTALGSFDYVGKEGFTDSSDGIAIAFTPILNTDDGPKVLSNDEMDSYLKQIYANANGDANKLLEEDAKGIKMTVGNQVVEVKNMLASVQGAVVDGAKATAEDCAGISGMAAEDIKKQFRNVGRFANDSMHQIQEGYSLLNNALSETNPILATLLKTILQILGLDFSSLEDGMEDTADSANEATNAVSSLKTQMSEVSNAASDLKNAASDLSGVADAYKTLTTAIQDYNADGDITLSNIESLLSLSPEYLSCLEMENGQLSLNTEGLKGIVLMRIQAAKAAAYQSAMEQIQAITMSASATAADTAGEAIAGMEAATSNAATAASTASTTAATATGNMANLAQSGYEAAAGFDSAASSAANFNNVLANKMTEAKPGTKYTAASVADMIAGDTSKIRDVLGDAVGDVVDGLQSQLTMLDNLENQVNSMDFSSFIGKAGGSGSGSKGATKATDELTAALETQKKALESQKQALQDQKSALEEQKKALDELNNSLKENFKLYLDLIKTRLNKEIDKQTETIKAFYDAIKDSIQSEIDTFEDQLDTLNKKADELQKAADNQKDSLSKLYDAAKAYYDAASDGIGNEIAGIDRVIERNNEKVEVLKEQQDAIQAQIDALDDAADSESKLLALEKARDALATARQQKTRLVLTNGGGWRFKTDKSAVQEAQSNLASAQRDYQKEVLERQVKKLDNQIDGIGKVNDNLDDVKDGLEGQKEILSDISDQWDTINDSLGKTASEIQEQTELIKKFQYGSDDSRYGELTNFAGGVTNNQQQQQEASDASNKYEEQSNADKKGTLAEAIEKLKEQQNQADQAFEEYFTNQLSNNAESQKIQQEMKALIDSIVGTSIGSLEAFNQYQEGINSAFDRANESASLNAQYINNINAAISRYEEWSNRLGMTTDEINARQAIENEINNATLGSLIEGGVTFNKLNDQYKEAIKNNDTSADIDRQVKVVENQISDVEKQISDVSNRISEAKEAANKAASDTNKTINSAANRIANAVANQPKASSTTVVYSGGGGPQIKRSARYSNGGMLGFSHGGVDDITTVAAVHGTKNRPELVLNNSQSAALFKYIDSMTRIPTLSSAGSARNALNSFGTTNNTTNSGTNFTNCKFDIESNADNLDSLVQDLKQSASIRR